MLQLKPGKVELQLRALVPPGGAASGWLAVAWATRRIDHVSPGAVALLRKFFAADASVTHRLPAVVNGWLREAGSPSPTAALAVLAEGSDAIWLVGRKAQTSDGDYVVVLSLERLTPAGRARTLTTREREVLELVAAGLTNEQIAVRLSIAPNTVRKHLENSFTKLGVHTRTAAAFALAEECDTQAWVGAARRRWSSVEPAHSRRTPATPKRSALRAW